VFFHLPHTITQKIGLLPLYAISEALSVRSRGENITYLRDTHHTIRYRMYMHKLYQGL